MNKQIEEKKKLFEDAWKIRSDFEKEDFNLEKRANNAKKEIEIISFRKDGAWYWRLPDILNPQNGRTNNG